MVDRTALLEGRGPAFRLGAGAAVPAGAIPAAAPSGSTAITVDVGLAPRDPQALVAYATGVATKYIAGRTSTR